MVIEVFALEHRLVYALVVFLCFLVVLYIFLYLQADLRFLKVLLKEGFAGIGVAVLIFHREGVLVEFWVRFLFVGEVFELFENLLVTGAVLGVGDVLVFGGGGGVDGAFVVHSNKLQARLLLALFTVLQELVLLALIGVDFVFIRGVVLFGLDLVKLQVVLDYFGVAIAVGGQL